MKRQTVQVAVATALLSLAATRVSAQDVTPPSLIAGSLAYAVFPAPYAEVADPFTVTVGGEVRLALMADEALAGASVRFSGPEAIDVTGTIVGTAASFDLPVVRPLMPGTYIASLHLVDLAGNATDIPLALPAPGFVVDAFVWSPCTLLDPDGSAVCSDVDADGRPGRSTACPTLFDCDDTNPTIHPRAPEIPGDGVDNDCSGNGDVPVDEAAGVFVARRGSSSSLAGTRQRPLHKLTDAVALALATGRVVFVSNEGFDGATVPSSLPVTVIGGFDAGTWTRAPFSRTTIDAAATVTVSAPLLVGVEFRLAQGADLAVATPLVTTLIDVGVTGPGTSTVHTTGQNRFTRVEIDGPTLSVDAGTLVVVRAELGAVTAALATALELNRSVVSGPVRTMGHLAVIRGFHTAPIMGDGAVMRLSSTTIRQGGSAAISSIAGVITLYNCTLAEGLVGAAYTVQTVVRAENNLFNVACPLEMDGTCDPTPCGSNGNLCGAPAFVASGDFHVSAGSVGVGAGMRRHPDKTPTSSVVDIDGDCRAGELDIGADEAR